MSTNLPFHFVCFLDGGQILKRRTCSIMSKFFSLKKIFWEDFCHPGEQAGFVFCKNGRKLLLCTHSDSQKLNLFAELYAQIMIYNTYSCILRPSYKNFHGCSIILLQQAEIKQQSYAMKDFPAECRNGSVDYWSTIKSYFLLQDDKCHAYYEHLMIDPVIKVPPTKVKVNEYE